MGSEYFTAYDDPTVEGTYGYYLYDDEGTPARRKVLVEKGEIIPSFGTIARRSSPSSRRV